LGGSFTVCEKTAAQEYAGLEPRLHGQEDWSERSSHTDAVVRQLGALNVRPALQKLRRPGSILRPLDGSISKSIRTGGVNVPLECPLVHRIENRPPGARQESEEFRHSAGVGLATAQAPGVSAGNP